MRRILNLILVITKNEVPLWNVKEKGKISHDNLKLPARFSSVTFILSENICETAANSFLVSEIQKIFCFNSFKSVKTF